MHRTIRVSEGGCWLLGNKLGLKGYVRLMRRPRAIYAHRHFYQAVVGPIAPGLCIDHLCRNRACVNPQHMEVVTPQENTRRGLVGKNTHCPAGHEYTHENTYRTKSGSRKCRKCICVASSSYKRRKREEGRCQRA